jgi:hypothetical protein
MPLAWPALHPLNQRPVRLHARDPAVQPLLVRQPPADLHLVLVDASLVRVDVRSDVRHIFHAVLGRRLQAYPHRAVYLEPLRDDRLEHLASFAAVDAARVSRATRPYKRYTYSQW